MKKYFKSKKWKKYLKRRAEACAKRKRKTKKYIEEKKVFTFKKRKASSVEIISAPVNFQLLENMDEVLLFSENLKKLTDKAFSILINMEKTIYISSESLLYLLSTMVNIVQYGLVQRIRLKLPSDPACRGFMKLCGFDNYLIRRGQRENYNVYSKIYTIQHGGKINPSIAGEIMKFSREHLNMKTIEPRSKKMYVIINEIMGNSVEHAYKYKQKNKKKTDWWLFAVFHNEQIEFTILDNGLTIPFTVRKDFSDKVKELLYSNNDYVLLESALKGEFRTSSKERHRGNGLPKIRDGAETGTINDLIIVSGKAFYNSVTKEKKELQTKFEGTLFRWSFK